MNTVAEPLARSAAAFPRPPWPAALSLAYARRGERTVLAARDHLGPLRVQRPLYPEGDAVCHTIVVHPPAGIAGGDELHIALKIGPDAHALLTTPGAGKWYRSAGSPATLVQRMDVASGGVCEWLPQESIVYDGTVGTLETDVCLEGDACFIGTEMLCFGRTASSERFARGELAMRTRITRDGRPLWLERGVVHGGGRLLTATPGLRGQPVSASLLIASPRCDEALRDAWREISPVVGEAGVSLLPGLLVARWLGPGCEPGRDWLTRLWACARPVVAGRAARTPRIWRT